MPVKKTSPVLTMAQRIAQASPPLTKSQRQMADFVMKRPLKVANLSIDGFAAEAGVSVATANRFARALKFDGYALFRTALIQDFEAAVAPVKKLRQQLERHSPVSDVFAASLAENQNNLARMQQSLDPASCERAVSAILGARRIFVLAYGNSSWLGGFLFSRLSIYCENVQMLASLEGPAHAAQVLRQMKPSDLVICLAFPRYMDDVVVMARRIHDAGIPILALTDRATSPLAAIAKISLYAHAESHYFSASGTSGLALIEALVSAVTHKSEDAVGAASDFANNVLPWLHKGGTSAASRGAPSSGRENRQKTSR